MPGLDGSGRFYAPLERELADEFDLKVLSYDGSRFDGYAGLVEELSPQLPSGNDVVLVAESFAGPLGVLLARRHPDRLKALVLAATFVHAPLPCSPLLAACLGRLPALRPPDVLLHGFLAGRGRMTAELRCELDEALRAIPLSILRLRALAALRADVRAELSELAIPLLYLQAVDDRLIGSQAGRKVLRHARHARLVRVDAPHFLFQTAPGEAAAAIRNFLSTNIDG
ncbi:alpha/beta hydrolase [Pseudoxanthomonas putridarboris]|uniref:Alpha/beta hydrolase n=1 Tax=Pseudoxanthomonas putridarboris TaxID=752605 RepID=A0ABU9J073_9GAMM